MNNQACNDIDNFVVYYGMGNTDVLTSFDLAVVEPKGHKLEDIFKLKESGTFVIAYISIVEIHPNDFDYKLFEEHLLVINGKTVTNPAFGTVYTDLTYNGRLDYLYQKAKEYLTEGIYDGLFLDTVGDLENPKIPVNCMYKQIIGLTEFMKRIKDEFPDTFIIQNNGLEKLLTYTKEYINGICWENPDFENNKVKSFNKIIINKLNNLKNQFGLQIFLLTEECRTEKKVKKIADKNGFTYYNAPKDYIEINRINF